jgi:hypothetical protein
MKQELLKTFIEQKPTVTMLISLREEKVLTDDEFWNLMDSLLGYKRNKNK